MPYKFTDQLEYEITRIVENLKGCPFTPVHRRRIIAIMYLIEDMLDETAWRHRLAYSFRDELQAFGVEKHVFRSMSPHELDETAGDDTTLLFQLNGRSYCFDSWTPLTGV